MTISNITKALLFLQSFTSYGDMCSEFCVQELGPFGCAKGSWCKKSYDCHSLFWTGSSPRICVFPDNGDCHNVHPVLCSEAESSLRGSNQDVDRNSGAASSGVGHSIPASVIPPTTFRGVDGTSRFGEIVNPASTTHSATILLLHGMRGKAQDMIAQGSGTWLERFPSAKFVSLDAGGNPWFEMAAYPPAQLLELIDAGQEFTDRASLDEAMHALVSKIDEEAALLAGGHSKVFLIGYSQGGMLSLWTALKGDRGLGGAISLSGPVPISNIGPLSENGKNVPIVHFHGEQDRYLPFEFARMGEIKSLSAGSRNYNLFNTHGGHDPSNGVHINVLAWLADRV